MNKRNVVIGLFAVALLFGNVLLLAHQQAVIHQQQVELNEYLNMDSELREWGATVYMNVYRGDVLLASEVHHNLIPDAARSALRGHIADSALAEWNYLAIGTSTGGGTGSTALENEYERYQAVYATVGSFNFSLTLTFAAGNFSGQTITEYGIFNDPTTGTILSYDDNFSRGPLTAEDSLQVIAMFQVGS